MRTYIGGSNEPQYKLSEKQEEAGGKANVTEGVNLFKVHCTKIWNYHNETPLYY
jgi:hypothetical protein